MTIFLKHLKKDEVSANDNTKDTYADNDNISNGLFNQILSAGAFGSGKIKRKGVKKMIFSANKMKTRLIAEGKEAMITDEILSIMNKLDGKEVEKNRFKALVHDEIEYGTTVNGEYYTVNINDCE